MLGAVLNNKVNEIINQCKHAEIKYSILHYVGVGNVENNNKFIAFFRRLTNTWSRSNYHLLINTDGTIQSLEPIGTRVYACNSSTWSKYSVEKYIGNHTLHICFKTENGYTMNSIQQEALIYLYKRLIEEIPGIQIGGHREFPDFSSPNKLQQTLCPGFSVKEWLKANKIKNSNIFHCKSGKSVNREN